MFHKHNWIIIKETFGKADNIKCESMSISLAEKFYLGVTTILWECSVCKKIRKEEMLGK